MQIDVEIKDIKVDFETNKTIITLYSTDKPSMIEKWLNKAKKWVLKPHENKRSNDANALMWSCIQELAYTYQPPRDKIDIYHEMLRKYGQFTYILVEPQAIESMQKAWKESEIIGEVNINGHTQIQMLCFFGSSTYTQKEFSLLLDGIIGEMVAEGLKPPSDEEKWKALERQYEKT